MAYNGKSAYEPAGKDCLPGRLYRTRPLQVFTPANNTKIGFFRSGSSRCVYGKRHLGLFEEKKFEMEEFEYDFPNGLVYDETGEQYDDGLNYISSFIEYSTEKPKDDIAILKLPTNKPYEVFAYIPMGGFNDCPMPQDMVVVAKYWYEKFGAIPVSITYDEVEFVVEKPPTDKKDVDHLAIEQTVFCIDIVEQGVGSVEELAKGLKNSPYWYFWWD